MTKYNKFRIIKTDWEFNNLKSVWELLLKSQSNHYPSLTHEWLYTWWVTFGKIHSKKLGNNKQLAVVLVYEEEHIVSILPLINICRSVGCIQIHVIEFISQQWGGAYCDVIGVGLSKNEFAEIFDWLHTQIRYDLVFLKHIPFCSTSLYPSKWIYAACPELDLSQYTTFEELVVSVYSKNLKQNMRTAINRANRDGFTIKKSTHEYTDELYDQIISVSKSKLTDGKSCVYLDDDKKKFYRSILRLLKSDITTIYVNDILVAYRTNVYFGHISICLDAAFDRKFPRYELGSHSVDESLKEAFNKQIRVHSMGPGLDNYKAKFTKKIMPLLLCISPGKTVIGKIAYFFVSKIAVRREIKFKSELNEVNNNER